MRKAFPMLWVILLVFLGLESFSWSATLSHDSLSDEYAETPGAPVQIKELQEDFEKQLKSLLRDLEKLEKEAKEKMTKEILPYLRQEIEKIKKWLKEFRIKREKEEHPERIRTWRGKGWLSG
jgi:peptidoglycan hydrolase CwlO-like protein